jgi:hypothetical protein
MKLCWSNTGVYAELELHPDETHEWFFKNRSTGEFHGTTEPVGDGVERRFAELVSAAVKK